MNESMMPEYETHGEYLDLMVQVKRSKAWQRVARCTQASKNVEKKMKSFLDALTNRNIYKMPDYQTHREHHASPSCCRRETKQSMQKVAN